MTPSAPTKRPRWVDHGDGVETAIVRVRLAGWSKLATVALRVDDRGSRVRLDLKASAIEPWEARDNGRGFPTRRAAKRAAREWLDAANAGETLSPPRCAICERHTAPTRLVYAVGGARICPPCAGITEADPSPDASPPLAPQP